MASKGRRLSRQLSYLHTVAADGYFLLGNGDFRGADRNLAFVSIQLLNAFAEFARAFALSLIEQPLQSHGVRVNINNPTIQSGRDIIIAAFRRRKPQFLKQGRTDRRDEPAWYEPATLLETCAELQVSNYSQVVSAFAYSTRVFQYLPTIRNFYAHRNFETAIKARNIATRYSMVRLKHPTMILASFAYGRMQPLLTDWIDDVRIVGELLCK